MSGPNRQFWKYLTIWVFNLKHWEEYTGWNIVSTLYKREMKNAFKWGNVFHQVSLRIHTRHNCPSHSSQHQSRDVTCWVLDFLQSTFPSMLYSFPRVPTTRSFSENGHTSSTFPFWWGRRAGPGCALGKTCASKWSGRRSLWSCWINAQTSQSCRTSENLGWNINTRRESKMNKD